jgi:hypothetical protein
MPIALGDHNQAELVDKLLARLLGIPFRSYLLVGKRPRPRQLCVARLERWETGVALMLRIRPLRLTSCGFYW